MPTPAGARSAGLRSRTRAIDTAVDLVAVAADDGVLFEGDETALAGRGEALRIQVDRRDPGAAAETARSALAAIAPGGAGAGEDRPGWGPVALGAWPFDPREPGELVVPTTTFARSTDGTAWVTTVLPVDETDEAHDAVVTAVLRDVADSGPARSLAGFASSEPRLPGGFDVRSTRPPGEWCEAVAAACDELRAGGADKVVLAREVLVTADADIPVGAVLRRLAATFPDCLRYSVDGFVGASPELLVARSGDVVRCHPMAGTAPRRGRPDEDARLAADLAASDKNRAEHRHTIDLVHEALLPYCSFLDEEAEPSIVATANVQHLATRLEGRLSTPSASIVELATVLHPTPAVCGRPRSAALAMIERHEALDRGPYAGPVGWVDQGGNGAWAVGIRGAVISGATARLLAGVGVVADSDPGIELAETRAKLGALLGAIVRP